MSSTEILKYYRERLTIERQDEHLHTIQMQVRVLNNLLDNVMVIQKYAIGTLVYGPAPQDLEALCRTVIEETSGMIYDQRDFRVQVGGQLPPVAYDERLLRLALTNLLLNAVQYSDEHVPVDLTLTIADDQALIQVQDRGIGIPPDEQGRVFDLFYRARNVQSTNGQGLGLTVVQNIVSLHKGTMSLESTPGQGTKVTICLPVG